MKVTVKFTAAQIKSIQAVTDQEQPGEAVRRLLLDAIKLKRPFAHSDQLMVGEWALDLPDLATSRHNRTPA